MSLLPATPPPPRVVSKQTRLNLNTPPLPLHPHPCPAVAPSGLFSSQSGTLDYAGPRRGKGDGGGGQLFPPFQHAEPSDKNAFVEEDSLFRTCLLLLLLFLATYCLFAGEDAICRGRLLANLPSEGERLESLLLLIYPTARFCSLWLFFQRKKEKEEHPLSNC